MQEPEERAHACTERPVGVSPGNCADSSVHRLHKPDPAHSDPGAGGLWGGGVWGGPTCSCILNTAISGPGDGRASFFSFLTWTGRGQSGCVERTHRHNPPRTTGGEAARRKPWFPWFLIETVNAARTSSQLLRTRPRSTSRTLWTFHTW